MAVSNFIPDVWSASLLTSLQGATVAGGLCNRDYEGQIRGGGDSVKVTSLARPTVGDYTRNTPISTELLSTTQTTLSIDVEKYFSFALDDVDAAQATGTVMGSAMSEASYALKDALDAYVFTTMAAVATAVGVDIAVSTAADAYDALVDLAVALDEANVPTDGRWVAVAPSFHGTILKDARFVQYDAATRAGGKVGEAAGLTIVKSNNLPADTLLAGVNAATTLAEQVVSVEAIRSAESFADVVRGLHVYGAKVVRPEAVVKTTLA